MAGKPTLLLPEAVSHATGPNVTTPHNQQVTTSRRTSSRNKKGDPKGTRGDAPLLSKADTLLIQISISVIIPKTRKHSADSEGEAPAKKKGKSE